MHVFSDYEPGVDESMQVVNITVSPFIFTAAGCGHEIVIGGILFCSHPNRDLARC